MERNEVLTEVQYLLIERNLGEAIAALDRFLAVHPHQINTDRLFAIKTDFQLMADYWRHGFKDPQSSQLYNNLLKRMYVLYANIASNYTIRHTPFLASLFYRAHMTPRDWSPQVIKEELESFVSEVAMLDLEPAHTSEKKRSDLYERHYRSMIELFDYIITSGIWTDSFATSMEDVLLAPTVDSYDQQLIISSVMLSAMNYFDAAKFRLLMHVYQQATDEEVRQRALIGWVFSLDTVIVKSLYPEELELLRHVLEDEHCCQELTELQKQVIFCINAEQDNATIQNEIMPDIMKHQGFQITKDGVVEQEEDSLRDILHPDEAEENLEKVEASFRKMIDMQKQGSDIYFGGFSQMKRFSFFNELVNWLMPFDMNHPGINAIVSQFKDSRFLKTMMKNGPFCNSDKYSFMLAFEQVLSRLPQNVRDMLDRGEASIQAVSAEETSKPAYIRRIYLQDLYRFFRLFTQRDAFENIFDLQEQNYLFFASSLYSNTPLEQHFHEISSFLIKKKRTRDLIEMLGNYDLHIHDFQYFMMCAYVGQTPLDNYARALELQPDNERALAGYARALFSNSKYQEALDIYIKLEEKQPDKKSYLLNKSICQTKLQQYDEAEKVLFRLNYESPDDINVTRVLAWTLTCNGKYEQAEKFYEQLMSVKEPLSEDILNNGYRLWFSGRVDEAIDCFSRYLRETGQGKQFILDNEKELIRLKGITEPECQMMFYML